MLVMFNNAGVFVAIGSSPSLDLRFRYVTITACATVRHILRDVVAGFPSQDAQDPWALQPLRGCQPASSGKE